MQCRLAIVSVSLVILAAILSLASWASGQQPPSPRSEELRREIIKVRAAIAEQTNRLKQLEQELAAIDAPRIRVPQPMPPGLRFPVDIERAMMGQRNTQRLLQPLIDPPTESRTTTRPAPKK